MADNTGKQLSFGFGEVSPIVHNKSDSPFFTAALKQAVNGTVRTTGGFSNRPGTELFKTNSPLSQQDITSKTNGVRIYSYVEPTDLMEYTIVIGKTIPGSVGASFPQFPEMPVQIFDKNGNLKSILQLAIIYTSATDGAEIDLDTVEFKRIKGEVVVTFAIKISAGPSYWEFKKYFMFTFNKFNDLPGFDFTLGTTITQASKIGNPASPSLGTLDTYYLSAGLQPQPVAYKVYQELFDGSEFIWQESAYVTGMPSNSATNQVKGYDLNEDFEVKQYNVYRAAAAIGPSATPVPIGMYALVGRIPADGTIEYNGDSLAVPDMTTTPPNDESIDSVVQAPGSIKKVFYSKERYLVVPAEAIDEDGVILPPSFGEGTILASKLGSKFFWKRGLAPNELDAFSFTLDSDNIESCDIRALADVENSLVFTAENVYAIRGSDKGVISYASVNPIVVYNEGIAKNVVPATLSNQAFYLNADRSKIISLRASDANSESYIPDNVSHYSSHLLKKRNMKRMVATKGSDVIVWSLTSEGKLISITYDESANIKGFARHDVGGFVEDLTVVKVTNDPSGDSDFSEMVQSIRISVIRNGVRYLETLSVRDDENIKNFMYADSSVRFNSSLNPRPFIIELQAADFSAGNPITVVDTTGMDPWIDADLSPKAFDILKEDGSYVRLFFQSWVDESTIIMNSDYDIPIYLQNTELGSDDYLIPIKEVSGLEHLAGKEVSVYAQGVVLSSPLNKASDLPVLTVALDGTLDLGDFYQWGYVGLPYKFLAQTLPLETSDNRTFADKGKLINSLSIALDSTIGGFVSQNPDVEINTNNVSPLMYQRNSDMYNPQQPANEVVDQVIPAEWDMAGSLCVIQVDPLPITMAAVYPKGIIGG